jgi:hypothetical protein
MMGSEDARNCVPSTVARAGRTGQCGPEEIYSVSGHYCIHCPVHMRSSPDGKRCIAFELYAIYEFHSNCGQTKSHNQVVAALIIAATSDREFSQMENANTAQLSH